METIITNNGLETANEEGRGSWNGAYQRWYVHFNCSGIFMGQ